MTNTPSEVKMLHQIKQERSIAKRKAFQSLSGYKFYMFGYWAAAWVKYNALLPAPMKEGSPFKSLVEDARNHINQEGE